MKQQKPKKIPRKRQELASRLAVNKDAKTSVKTLLDCWSEEGPPPAPHNTTQYLIDLHEDAEEYTEDHWGSMLLKGVC